ncbi:N-acetyltransferase [Kitasatospora sp. NPDC006697]|uniref:N-acetyltransferase n=1 Tax=Kitasatospora sp. NPDC006697 TaxID=3364020 RepID=UPI00367F7353
MHLSELTVTTLAERPEYADRLWGMPDSWAAFMLHDTAANACFGLVPELFPEYVLIATDRDGELVARGLSAPFALTSPKRGGLLPDRGWDAVLLWAVADHRRGDTPDTVTALEIAIRPDAQGTGLSTTLLTAMRRNAAARGFTDLVAPVRPSAKHQEPDTPMSDYAFRSRPADGLPHDPWLRVHVRAGATIEKVAPASMTIPGSLPEWRTWTGLPFDTPGPVLVPGALVPVHCDVTAGVAVYVEPNVWVRHRL